jgi:mannosyltransferase
MHPLNADSTQVRPSFPPHSGRKDGHGPSGASILWALAGLTALGIVVRFASLGLQSYHHDEVITAMRVIPGSFGDMLHSVKASESNPPLYYVLAWGWAKLFGTGEVGLRSLSALFGAATVPIGYLIGRELTSRRAGLVLAALIAVNPMLIWYSQEARSYALLVFFGALATLFFVRALNSRRGSDLALWALASALALCSHYFAVFAVAIEAVWLLILLRDRWRAVLPALGAVGAVGLALLPLANSQTNPTHIGWIENSPLPERFWETAVSFLVGETGHVIAEAPRERYALVPIALVGASLLLVALWGRRRERWAAGLGLLLGLGIAGLTALAALLGKDYVVERNLLPALVPSLAVAAIGFAGERARRLGLLLAVALCAYWLAFDVHVTQTPNLQRPDFRTVTDELGPPRAGRRAIVTWKLAADPVRFYLRDRAVRMYGGEERIEEIAVLRKPLATGKPINLPPSFHQVSRVRADRLTLNTYVSKFPVRIPYKTLHNLPTGFGDDAVLIDGPRFRPGVEAVAPPPAAAVAPSRKARP